MSLNKKITNKSAKIGIIGLGYVGLPLAIEFGKAGFTVIGVDNNPAKINKLQQGESNLLDISTTELKKLLKAKRLQITDSFASLKKADAICICVPTPLNKHKQPDLSYILNATAQIAKILRKGQLIILQSTTFPGTTDEVVLPLLSKTGLKAGKDFFLAFSPERIDPGNKRFSIKNTPKIVGGITPRCTELAKALYEQISPEVHAVSSPRVAELEKLLENVFRNVNIALVNELSLLCKKMNIDVWEVIKAASTKPYGFMPFYPGPGVGGHCIPVDPFYLSWKAREYGLNLRFIELAGEVNDRMPEHIINLIQDSLNKSGKRIKGSAILILGVAYKKDIADTRESPGLKIIELLLKKGANVAYHDPFVNKLNANGRSLGSIFLSPANLKNSECVVVVTNHSNYDYNKIVKHSRLIIDTRNAIKSHSPKVIKL
jgi:UDP-N-acetyl-D-glucosamine dehydrogenase